jgi:hypothetical protein
VKAWPKLWKSVIIARDETRKWRREVNGVSTSQGSSDVGSCRDRKPTCRKVLQGRKEKKKSHPIAVTTSRYQIPIYHTTAATTTTITDCKSLHVESEMKFPTFLSLTGLLLLLPTSTFALPQQSSKQSTPAKHYNNNNKSKCTAPVKRVEWRQMRPADQQSYLDSVLCLKTKPSRIGLNSSTLYDDFAYVHFNLSKQSK